MMQFKPCILILSINLKTSLPNRHGSEHVTFKAACWELNRHLRLKKKNHIINHELTTTLDDDEIREKSSIFKTSSDKLSNKLYFITSLGHDMKPFKVTLSALGNTVFT